MQTACLLTPAPTRREPCPPRTGNDRRPDHCRKDRIEVWIVSAGGVGSNAVWEWLRRSGLRVGYSNGAWGRLCHALSPQPGTAEAERLMVPSVRRALFLYGDPCEQMHSIYRQGYATSNLLKKLDAMAEYLPVPFAERRAALGSLGMLLNPPK